MTEYEARMLEHASRQTAALEKVQKRLAPDGANMEIVKFLGTEAVGSRKIVQCNRPINVIKNAIQGGRVYVYFDGHGATGAAPDDVLDASNQGQHNYGMRNCATIAFEVVDPARGPIHVEFY